MNLSPATPHEANNPAPTMRREKPYTRLLLKLSGEALKGEKGFGIDFHFVHELADEVVELVNETGLQLAVVIGGGNFLRGGEVDTDEIDRATADYMGMMATLLNALALQAAFEKRGLPTRVMSGLEVRAVAEPYIRRRAVRHLEKGRVVIFAAGTGNPFFTTDTGAALRGAEIGAQAVLKATNVDGVYTADPRKDPAARLYTQVSFTQALTDDLRVMDATALSLCRENCIPVVVFDLHKRGNIRRVVRGEAVGTLVGEEEAAKA